MHMREKTVRIAGQSFTVPAVVRQMRIMPAALSAVFMSRAVNCLKRELNVPL
jgi:hypothetical protein